MSVKLSEKQVKDLLSLKRHEKPPEGYLDGFVKEFHLRCREESVRREHRDSPWRRLAVWLAEPGPAKWVYAGGLAYAVVLAVVALLPREQPGQQVPALRPVSHPVVVPLDGGSPAQLEKLDLRPSTQGRPGEQEF